MTDITTDAQRILDLEYRVRTLTLDLNEANIRHAAALSDNRSLAQQAAAAWKAVRELRADLGVGVEGGSLRDDLEQARVDRAEAVRKYEEERQRAEAFWTKWDELEARHTRLKTTLAHALKEA